MAVVCDFKYTKTSIKSDLLKLKAIDKFMNIKNLDAFRRYVTKWSRYAVNKFNLEAGSRLLMEHNGGTVAEFNNEMLRNIDLARYKKPNSRVTPKEVDDFYLGDDALREQEERDSLLQESTKRGSIDPTIKAKLFKYKNRSTTTEILQTISEGSHPLAPVAKKLLEFIPEDIGVFLEKEVTVDVKGKKTKVAGVYFPTQNIIRISESARFRGLGAEPTVIHEILHYLTYYQIRRGGRNVDQLRELYNKVKKNPKFKGEYALTDLDEFVVAIFTDASFIKKLMETPSENENSVSMWQDIWEYIIDLFGLNQAGLYNEAFALGSNVIYDNMEYAIYKDFFSDYTMDSLSTPDPLLDREVYNTGQLEMFQLNNKQDKSSAELEQEINHSINTFLETLGFKVNPVGQIFDANGNPIDAVAKVDLLNRIIDIAKGKADISTLPEEASHILVDLLEASKDPLFNEMMENIESFEEYNEVYKEYWAIYNGNIHKIRKEAVGKVISRMITEGKYKEQAPKHWLDRFIAFIKRLFGQVDESSYVEAARRIMSENVDYFKSIDGVLSGSMYQTSNPKTRAETEALLKETNDRLTIEEIETSGLTSRAYKGLYKTIKRYKDRLNSKIVGNRVTDAADLNFRKKVGDERAKEIQEYPVSAIMRETGTRLHDVSAKILDFLVNNVGDLKQIKEESELMTTDFERLVDGLKEIIANMEEVQNSIDSSQKFSLHIEQKVWDQFADVAGSLDMLFLFSDNSAAILDFKFKQMTNRNSVVKEINGESIRLITNEIVEPYSEESYDMQIGGYASILTKRYGISKVRIARVVPIAISLFYNKDKKELTNKVTQLEIGKKSSSFLRQIASIDEETNYERVNIALKKLNDRILLLKNEHDNTKNAERRELLRSRIIKLEESMQDILVDFDFKSSISNVYAILKDLHYGNNPDRNDGRLHVADDDSFTFEEIEFLIRDLDIYTSLLSGAVDYIDDNKKMSSEEKTKLKRNVEKLFTDAVNTTEKLKDLRISKTIKFENQHGVNIDTPTKELDAWQKMLASSSEIDNPIIQAAVNHFREADYKTMFELEKLRKEIETELDLLSRWANARGLKGTAMFDALINNKTGNLHSMFSEKLGEDLRSARERGDVKFIKALVELRPNYLERYKKRLAKREEFINRNFADFVDVDGTIIKRNDIRTRELARFKRDNDPSLDSFWLNPGLLKYAGHIKEIHRERYYSDGYKNILATPELKRFYEFYVNKNIEFRDVIGYDKITPTFIANIRKDIVESLANKTMKFRNIASTLLGNLYLRQDGVMGQVDQTTGETINSIPILYTNPIRNSEGKIDTQNKSRDLGRLLYMFGNTVYNYKNKSETEAITLALRDFMEANRNGELMTTGSGKIRSDRDKRDIKSQGRPIEALNVFNKILKFHLYGQKLQSKDYVLKLGKHELSFNKVALGLKQYYSLKVLAFSIIPPAAAGISGAINTMSEAAKDRFFNRKDVNKAMGMLAKQDKKAKFAFKYLSVYQEDMKYRNAKNLSVRNATKIFSSETAFKGYSFTDERLDDWVTLSFLISNGIDSDGNIVRLSKLPAGSKSLYDRINITGDTGNIEGLTEESYAQLRKKIRWIGKTIKGQLTTEEIMGINTTLFGQLLMQFKNWMPGVVQERFGKLRYVQDIDMIEQGRYSVMATEFFYTNEELAGLGESVFKGMARLLKDALVFWKPIYEVDKDKAEFLYRKFVNENSYNEKIKNMTLEQFIEMRQGQMRALAVELRMALAFLGIIFMLGADWDDDGEKDYKKWWVTRKMMAAFRRAQTELHFMHNPEEWYTWTQSLLPVTGLIQDALKGIRNFKKEIGELITGESDNRDKTPLFYYGVDWVFLDKIFSFFEWFKKEDRVQ